MAVFRFMVIDEDGQRVGRFETGDPDWRASDIFALDEQAWRIVEILPEVSTMVAYNAVWVAAPAIDEDEQATLDWPVPDAVRRARIRCKSTAKTGASTGTVALEAGGIAVSEDVTLEFDVSATKNT